MAKKTKRKSVSVSRNNSRTASPQEHVLDLRTIIAKRDAQKESSRRAVQKKHGRVTHKRTEKKGQRKNANIAKKTSRDTQTASLWKRVRRSIVLLPEHALDRLSLWFTPKKKTTHASTRSAGAFFQRSARRVQKKKTQKDSTILPARINKSTLPKAGFSFAAVGKPLVVFLVLSVVIVLPPNAQAMFTALSSTETTIQASAEEAVAHLLSAGEYVEAMNFAEAEAEFQEAKALFESAQNEVHDINIVVRTIAPWVPGKGKTFASGDHLLNAGYELAASGQKLSGALALLTSADIEKQAQDVNTGITPLVLVAHSSLLPSQEHIAKAVQELDQVDLTAIPEDKRGFVAQAQEALPAVEGALQEGIELSELLLAFLGQGERNRYLVLFTNDREMRPCAGGFPGTIGIFDVENGVIANSDISGGGIYDIAGQVQTRPIAPQPLHLVNANWNIQDAGWFPHFPSCAKKIQQFMEDTNDALSVDGVVAVTPDVVESILRITGPMNLGEEFGVVDAENFYDVVQVQAEKKFDEDPESKRIITDMAPLLFEQVFSATEDHEQLIALLELLKTSLDEKDMMVYVNDEDTQKMFSDRRWSGELLSTEKDYLHVSIANIGGGKTSQALDNTTHLTTEIQEDGTVLNTLEFQRVHKGDSENIFEGVNNFAFVRLYLPQGSSIISAQGFDAPNPKLFFTPDGNAEPDPYLQEISGDILVNTQNNTYTNTEYGKDVIGGWMLTPVGGSSSITIQYTLPFSVSVDGFFNSTDQYSLLMQKQAGVDMLFEQDIRVPDTLSVRRIYPAGDELQHQQVLTQDIFRGIVFTEQD